MKKKNAIMIADTRPALIGHLLLQIKETNNKIFEEALIYYDKISENDKKVMQKIIPCKFIKYDSVFSKDILSQKSFQTFSNLMFSRYEMFKLLDEYETITWIDTDVLIKGSLENVILKAKETGMSANFENKNDKSYKAVDFVSTSFKNGVKLAKYNLTKYNMSSGLICVSDNLKNYKKMTDWCYRMTNELSDKLLLPDQGILNIMIQEFNINVNPLGEKGSYCVYPFNGRDTSNVKIIHAWGKRKFWNNYYLYKKYPEWNNYYQQWLELGGSKFFTEEIKPLLSIIMPTFKPNIEYLKDSIDSILKNQIDDNGFDFDSVELIIVAEPVDIDELKIFINTYDDPRINLIINTERLGIAKSLNIGIKNSKANYIARMDDDDISLNQRLFLQYTYLRDHPEINLVTSNYEYFGDFSEKRLSLSGSMVHAWSIFTCPFDHPTIMFNKSFFVNNNLYYDENRKFVEDWELWIRAFDKGLKVGSINQILFKHRWYNTNASSNTKSQEMMRELIKSNFKKLNVDIEEEDLYFIGPWNGYANAEELFKLNEYFEKALDNNEKLKIYNQRSLKRVFDIRLSEATTGRLSYLIIGNAKEYKGFKHNVKKIFYPLYKPFKNQMTKINKESNIELLNRIEILEEELDELKSLINKGK